MLSIELNIEYIHTRVYVRDQRQDSRLKWKYSTKSIEHEIAWNVCSASKSSTCTLRKIPDPIRMSRYLYISDIMRIFAFNPTLHRSLWQFLVCTMLFSTSTIYWYNYEFDVIIMKMKRTIFPQPKVVHLWSFFHLLTLFSFSHSKCEYHVKMRRAKKSTIMNTLFTAILTASRLTLIIQWLQVNYLRNFMHKRRKEEEHDVEEEHKKNNNLTNQNNCDSLAELDSPAEDNCQNFTEWMTFKLEDNVSMLKWIRDDSSIRVKSLFRKEILIFICIFMNSNLFIIPLGPVPVHPNGP